VIVRAVGSDTPRFVISKLPIQPRSTRRSVQSFFKLRALSITTPESFRGLRKFLQKNPDFAALHPGYELSGARSAPYQNLRALRDLRGTLRFPTLVAALAR
jgi:hypothetical protein